MSAMSGDLLGVTGVLMPSGFSVAVAPPAPPSVGGGPIGRRKVQPNIGRAPTYHAIEVSSLITFLGVAEAQSATPLEADGLIAFAGMAEAASVQLVGSIAGASMRPLAVEASLALVPLEAAGAITFVSEVAPQSYNEADVRFVLGLP